MNDAFEKIASEFISFGDNYYDNLGHLVSCCCKLLGAVACQYSPPGGAPAVLWEEGAENICLASEQSLHKTVQEATRIFPVSVGANGCLELFFKDSFNPSQDQSKLLSFVASILSKEQERYLIQQELLHHRADIQKRVLEEIEDRVTVTDLEGRITYVNNAECRSLRKNLEQLIGQSVEDYVESPEQKELQRQIVKKTRDEGAWRGEVVNHDAQGQEVLFHCRTGLLKDERDKPYAMFGIATDITEQRRMEQALRESEAALSFAQELAGIGSYVWEIKKDKLRWSKNMFQIAGLLEKDFSCSLHSIMPQLIHEDDRKRVAKALEEMLATKSTWPFEFRIIRPDGEERLLRSASKFFFDKEGNPETCIGVHFDITEQRKMEKEKQKADVVFRKVFEILPVGLWLADAEGKLIQGNPAGIRIWGARPLVGIENYGVFKARHFPSRREIAPEEWALFRTIREGVTITDELLEIDAFDGQKRIVLNYTAPVHDDEGNLLGAVIVNNDISERIKAEEQFMESERKLLHAQKLESLGVLAGGIAHDFNNVLMAISGNLDVALLDTSPGSPVRERLEQAVKACKQAAAVANQMLAYSGRGSFLVAPVELNSLLQDNANLLRTSVSRTITIRLKLAPELPLIEADRGQLQQVIMNLIINASEAIEDRPGEITLSTGVEYYTSECLEGSCIIEKPAPGYFVYLEVSDSGAGMDDKTKQQLFEPFFTTKFTGRGLGMSAVLGILRSHKGAIFVESALGCGTTVRVLFPEAQTASFGAAKRAPEDKLRTRTTDSSLALPGAVLVVDDEPGVREFCVSALQHFGVSSFEAPNGAEALNVFSKNIHQIFCVLLDLTMPEMDGLTTFRELRKISPGIAVVLSSGYTKEEVAARFAEDAPAAFIKKPYRLQELREILRCLPQQGPRLSS